MSATAHDRLLVTGGTGFLGAHVVAQALAAGHEVRATVRHLGRAEEVAAAARRADAPVGRLDVVAVDLGDDTGWADAVRGCRSVLHVASPFPAAEPDDAEQVIGPARDGVLRVLAAARAAGVERVVLTSSFAAVGYPPQDGRRYDESSWTDPTPDLPAYIRSKAVAERAAWDDVAAHGGPELVALAPTGILGPVLGDVVSTSPGIVRAMLAGAMPVAPAVAAGFVDVRDVASVHLRAATTPDAARQRFLLTSGPALSLVEVAAVLRERLPDAAQLAPTTQVEGPEPARPVVDTSRARRVLGFAPRPVADTIADTARSLLERGLVGSATPRP